MCVMRLKDIGYKVKKCNKYITLIHVYMNRSVLIRKTIRAKLKAKLLKRNRYVLNEKIVFNHRINCDVLKCPNYKEDIMTCAEHYLKHEYNFLGTGWKSWNRWNENKTSHEIMWNIDIISGFEFREPLFHSTLIDKLPCGTDIKIPWELGRMYHWPQLAMLAVNDVTMRERIIHEFKDQLYDFKTQNPIGLGVQFFCPMEVSIRVINLLIAYDILVQIDEKGELDYAFCNEMEQYFYMHGQVIISNLEYNFFTDSAGNHYLTDLCGLIWICMYFRTKRTQKYLPKIIEEFCECIQKQFLEDGSNFECSTGYHKLTTEIVVMGLLALEVVNIDKRDLCKLKRRLWEIVNTLKFFVAKDRRIIQIGDNDSGNVIKLSPTYIGDIEDTLDVTSTLELAQAFLGEVSNGSKNSIQQHFVFSLLQKPLIHEEDSDRKRQNDDFTFHPYQLVETKYMEYQSREIYFFDSYQDSWIIRFKKDFGLIKVLFNSFEIDIRTICDYSKTEIAHAHDDVFHFQFINEKVRTYEDLGSPVYTSNKKIRDFYVGVRSHNVPIHSATMFDRKGTFKAETDAKGMTYIKDNKIVISVQWKNIQHVRIFEILKDRLIVYDYSNDKFEINQLTDKYYSMGYGQLYGRKTNEHVRFDSEK